MRVVRWPGRHRDAVLMIGAVAVLLTCWMLLMPPGSQPDEHSHLVRSAALVRGSDGEGAYVVPDRYRIADPGCYAFDPFQPATCAPVPIHIDGDVSMVTRADGYPPGGHLVFGVIGLLPGLEPLWWARGAAVAVSIALFGAALVVAVRRRRVLGSALLVAATPTAWSTMTGVNPSAFAISGAIALWTGLLVLSDGSRHGASDRAARWLVTGGWVALVIGRRDGLVWACLITAFILVLEQERLVSMLRKVGRVGSLVMASAAAVTVVWGIGSPSQTSRLVVLAPIALAAPHLVDVLRGSLTTRTRRLVAVSLIVPVAALTWLSGVSTRRGGWSTALSIKVVEQTDDNLIEAIGVLGWLDTPVPGPVVFAWLISIGALLAAGVTDRTWIPATVLVALVLLTAWTFELLQGNESGTYWQGRYSLPLLVGLPIVLVHRCRSDALDRLVPALTASSLAAVHVAVWAAGRRFGVGIDGSRLPWNWDTPLQPVPPVVLVISSGVAAVVLAVTVVRPQR